MSEKDYEFLKRVSDISYTIKSIYKNMIKLTNEGKKDSEEFKQEIEKLKLAKEVEDNIYNKAYKVDLCKVLKYVLEKDKENSLSNDNENENTYYTTYRRIINKIVAKELPQNKNTDFLSVQYYNNSSLSARENTPLEELSHKLICEHLAYNDINKFVIYFLNSEKPENIEIQNDLEKVKYEILLGFPMLEDYFLNNNFDFNKKPFINSLIYLDLLNINRDLLSAVKYDLSHLAAEALMTELLSYDEESYKNDFIKTNAIIKSVYLRAYLLYIPYDELETILQDSLSFFIEDEEEKENTKQKISEKSINILNKVCEQTLIDKEEYKGIKYLLKK